MWETIIKSAIAPDGTLFFPERLSLSFLDKARRTMGSYLFANQYLNQVIPDDAQDFKKVWLRYYTQIPAKTHRFAFIDPAIGQKNHHDYTGIVVIDADEDGNWYIRLANRLRLTPTQIVQKCFDLHSQFQVKAIGIEVVAFQEALIYLVDQEMRRRNQVIPIKAIKRGAVSKNTRILGLVPRFEWGRIFLAQGLADLEMEYATFPRGQHDDLLDSLSSLEEMVYYPAKESPNVNRAPQPNEPGYESWYRKQLAGGNDDPHGRRYQRDSEPVFG